MNKSVVLNPSLSHQLCDFELKHRRGLFGTSMIAWWLLWGDYDSNRCGSFVRPTCYAGAIGSPILSNETMEPVSNEIWYVHNPASLFVNTLYLLDREMGNKTREKEVEFETNLEGLLKIKIDILDPGHYAKPPFTKWYIACAILEMCVSLTWFTINLLLFRPDVYLLWNDNFLQVLEKCDNFFNVFFFFFLKLLTL